MQSPNDVSGDLHAAHALASLKQQGIAFNSFGMGAGELEAVGTDILVDCRSLAVIGFIDVLLNYHRFLRRLKKLRRAMRERRPDVLFLTDYPDFNLKLAETAKELGIPVLFYVSPQLWAWRSGRIHRIGRLVSHMAVLFPFEVKIYAEHDIPVTFVGNPLVDEITLEDTPEEARSKLGIDAGSGPVIALLPGSRSGELSRNLPRMLDAARRLAERYPDARFVLPVAGSLGREAVEAQIEEANAASPFPHLALIDGESLRVMRAADVALVASGTATLETALIGTPMVVMYVVAPLNHAIMKRLIRIPDIALVNIVAERRVVPEFLQHEATGKALATAVSTLLDDPEVRRQMITDLAEVRTRLGDGGASEKVAELIVQLGSAAR